MNLTRRDFLGMISCGAIAVAAGSLVAMVARFLQPNVVTPVPGPVEIGAENEYAADSLTYIQNARAYLGRDARGFYAIVAICTHLGCTPHLDAGAIACPCHGSKFTREGERSSGAAPRALNRAFVGRAANGKLFVDRSRVVDANYRFAV